MAATFDTDLSAQVGDALGRACLAEKIGVLLGPGINMKRPAGRAQLRVLPEDPFLAGRMAAAYVNGVQAHGVAPLKHFAANNQETERFRYSADIDPRPLHETYLRAFEARGARSAAVVGDGRLQQDQRRLRDAGPVVAHRYAAGPVGFEGLVVSDWGAVDDRVASRGGRPRPGDARRHRSGPGGRRRRRRARCPR